MQVYVFGCYYHASYAYQVVTLARYLIFFGFYNFKDLLGLTRQLLKTLDDGNDIVSKLDCLSGCLPVHVPVYLSVCLSVCLSICLCVRWPA